MFGPRWLWVIVSVPLGFLLWYIINNPAGGTAGGPSTKLEIVITGGFAFVPTPAENKLEIAYLNSVDLKEDIDTDGDGDIDQPQQSVCNVQQMGTEMEVDRGEITSMLPAGPMPGVFNLDQAVVTFPALESANQALTIAPRTWPPTSPSKPGNPDSESDWHNPNWVAKLTDHHSASSLHPNWRSMVNGLVRVRGGRIDGTIPSNPILKKAQWEFKDRSGPRFTAAMTDKMVYRVDVPGTEVEILFNGSSQGYQRVVIKPQGNLVRLSLKGLHAMGTPPSLNNGDPLTDFCTFYQLMQPIPKSKDFLVPHYVASTPAGQQMPGNGSPSPGYFCAGDWF